MNSPMRRLAVLLAVLVGCLAMAATASAQAPAAVSTFTWTPNMHPLGHSARMVPLEAASPVDGIYNSDLAFWGKRAFQGTYEGFRIVDVADPENPIEINNYDECSPGTNRGNQGDVVVWGDILVRSWNSPVTTTTPLPTCDGETVPVGFEGLHIFSIADPTDPELLGSVALDGLPNLVTVGASSFEAAGAAFGTRPTAAGLSGPIVLVNDGVVGAGTPPGTVTDGCEPLVGFPAGAIALVDRGFCGFVVKAANAQAAGASALIVVNNVAGAPITMGGSDPAVTIPAVHVSQAAGAAIKAALPATGTVSSNPEFGCGSHTASGVPDLANGRLLVYNSSSAGGVCDFFEIVEVPLDDPGDASVIRRVDSMHTCHDIGVILGDVMKAACAGGAGARIFSLAGDGASLDNPVLEHHFDIPGVTIGHSAAWSWDGEVLIFGHEPGGGTQARCQATSAEVDRTLFFFEMETEEMHEFLHPRPQGPSENCTWHNYNVVPTDKGRILVSGNYQSGISVLDFTDPANVAEIAFADPAPLDDPDSTNPNSIEGGGDWSSYWYDGRIYESDMTRGLTIWNLSDSAVAGARKLGHLNPQTQETSFDLRLRGKR